MDSTWDDIKNPAATQIIEKYAPLVEPLQEIVAYSDAEYNKSRPESGLSNFAADVVREIAQQKLGKKVDVGLMNFGGIRTSIPKGAVRVYDIFSIFPFDNNLVVFDIKGSDLKKFITNAVNSNRVEAMSNVRLEIDGRTPVSIKVGGKDIRDNRIYRFATINFLMDGGDGVVLSDVAMNLISYDVWIRDAIIDYLRDMTAKGKVLSLKEDGRVIYLNEEE